MDDKSELLPDGFQVTKTLITKYRADLAGATAATEDALKQLRDQLTTMERQKVAIAAQKSLLDTLQRDLSTAVTTPPNEQKPA